MAHKRTQVDSAVQTASLRIIFLRTNIIANIAHYYANLCSIFSFTILFNERSFVFVCVCVLHTTKTKTHLAVSIRQELLGAFTALPNPLRAGTSKTGMEEVE